MVELQYMVLECVVAGSNCSCSLSLVLKRLGMCCIWMVMVLECVGCNGSCS